MGHRHTNVERIAAACPVPHVTAPEAQYLALIDTALLSHADHMPGWRGLIARNAPQDGGFGRYHKHLRACPFVSPGVNDRAETRSRTSCAIALDFSSRLL